MQKVVLVLVTGLLMFSASGCGSGEETEEVTSAPDATPTETELEATEEGVDSETEDTEIEEFQDPLVEERQEDQAAADAGLIQSTKPEERLLQLTGSNGQAPTTQPTDPFGVLPPLVVQGTPEEEAEMNPSLVADARQVPELPSLPIAALPPSWRSEVVVATPSPGAPGGNGNGSVTPGDTGTGSSTAETNPPQALDNSGSVAKKDTNGSATPGTPGTSRNGTGTTPPADTEPKIALSPAQIPALPQLPAPPAQSVSPPPVVAMPPAPPEAPPLEVATVPALPQLPPSAAPSLGLILIPLK